MAKWLKMVAICLYWACGSAVRLKHSRSDRRPDAEELREVGGPMACLTNYLYQKNHGEVQCNGWQKILMATVSYWSSKHHMALFKKDNKCAIGFSGGIVTGRQLLNVLVGTWREKTCDIKPYEAVFNKEFFQMTESLLQHEDGQAMITALKDCDSLAVTGHGLGGAMASIFAVCLTAGSPELGLGTKKEERIELKFDKNIEVHTFGAPPALVGAPHKDGSSCWKGTRFLVANTGWYDPVPYTAAAVGFEFLRTQTVSLSYNFDVDAKVDEVSDEAVRQVEEVAAYSAVDLSDKKAPLMDKKKVFLTKKTKSDGNAWKDAVTTFLSEAIDAKLVKVGEHKTNLKNMAAAQQKTSDDMYKTLNQERKEFDKTMNKFIEPIPDAYKDTWDNYVEAGLESQDQKEKRNAWKAAVEKLGNDMDAVSKQLDNAQKWTRSDKDHEGDRDDLDQMKRKLDAAVGPQGYNDAWREYEREKQVGNNPPSEKEKEALKAWMQELGVIKGLITDGKQDITEIGKIHYNADNSPKKPADITYGELKNIKENYLDAILKEITWQASLRDYQDAWDDYAQANVYALQRENGLKDAWIIEVNNIDSNKNSLGEYLVGLNLGVLNLKNLMHNSAQYYSCPDFDLAPPQNDFTGVGVGYVHQGWAGGAGLGVGAGVGAGLGVGLGTALTGRKEKLKFEGAGASGMGIGLGMGAGAGSLSGLAVGLLSGKGVPCTWWFDGPRCPSYSAHDAIRYEVMVKDLKLLN